MTWKQRHTLRNHLRSSLWPIPFGHGNRRATSLATSHGKEAP